MTDVPAVDFYSLRRMLDEADVFHRIGSIRDDTVLVEVRSTAFWEIEFYADGTVVYERFQSTGAILDARGFIDRVAQYADPPLSKANLEQPLNELAVMRLLRAAGINFSADELLMRKIMVEGAVMIEAAVPGEHWEIDVLPGGDIEVECFRSEGGVPDFDAAVLAELLASARDRQAPPSRRRGLRR